MDFSVRNFSHTQVLNLVEELKKDEKIMGEVQNSQEAAIASIKGILYNLGIEPNNSFSGVVDENTKEIVLESMSSTIFKKLKAHLDKLNARAQANAGLVDAKAKQDNETPLKPITPQGAAPETEEPEKTIERVSPEKLAEAENTGARPNYSQSLAGSNPTTSTASTQPSIGARFSLTIPRDVINSLKGKNRNDVRFELNAIISAQLENAQINPNLPCTGVNFQRLAGVPQICSAGANKTVLDVCTDIYVAIVFDLSKASVIGQDKENPQNRQQTQPMQNGQNPMQNGMPAQGMNNGVNPATPQNTNPAFPTQDTMVPTQNMEMPTGSTFGNTIPNNMPQNYGYASNMDTSKMDMVSQTSNMVYNTITPEQTFAEKLANMSDYEKEQLLRAAYREKDSTAGLTTEEIDMIVNDIYEKGEVDVLVELGIMPASMVRDVSSPDDND